MNEKMYEIIKNKEGFIAALDQSGGSSSKTLKAYGIPESSYSTEEEMEASLKRKVTFNEVANKMGMNPTELKLLFDLSNVASLDETVDDDREISAIEKIKDSHINELYELIFEWIDKYEFEEYEISQLLSVLCENINIIDKNKLDKIEKFKENKTCQDLLILLNIESEIINRINYIKENYLKI